MQSLSWPHHLVPRLIGCCVISGTSLDSVTHRRPLTEVTWSLEQSHTRSHICSSLARSPAEPYSGASYYHTGSGDQFPGLRVQEIKGCCLEGNACSFQAFRSLWEKGRLPCQSLLGVAVGRHCCGETAVCSGVASPVPPEGSHS